MFIWIGIDVDNQLLNIKEYALKIDKKLEFEHSCFTLPMHISLKMPFKINDDEFDEIINTVSDYYHSLNVFDIEIDAIENNECIAWIRTKENAILNKISYDLNYILKNNYSIGLHEYDLDYKFHITFFMDIDTNKVKKAFEQIKNFVLPQKLSANRFVIGTSASGDLGTYSILKVVDLKENEK